QGFGGYLRDDGAGTGTEVLRAKLHNDVAVGIDGGLALAVVAGAIPCGECYAESLDIGSGARVTALVPLLLPVHQFGGFVELIGVGFGARREAQVLLEHLDRVHLEFGGEVFEGAVGKICGLRMVGRAPGARSAGVYRDGTVVLPLVGNFGEHVWNGGHTAAANSTG